jgi:hypothetical protein
MSTSKLVKEDDEFLYLTRYFHDDPDEWPEWAMNERYETPERGSDRYQQAEWDSWAFYEIRCDYRIRKSDGKVFYDEWH